jgi:hypothetical protein
MGYKTSGYKTNGYKYRAQPLVKTEGGVVRFAENRIIRALLDHGRTTGYDLNRIHLEAQEGRFSIEEIEQLNQLIGYSVCGFCDISCHRSSVKSRAWKKAEKM